MTTEDLVAFSPFIATILVAAAILITDFIFPGRKGPALAVAFLGLGIVAAADGARRPGPAAQAARSTAPTSSTR